jgi:hypothetical protein
MKHLLVFLSSNSHSVFSRKKRQSKLTRHF